MSAVPQQSEAANSPVVRRQVDSTSEASGSQTPELVIALCGPIGSPLHAAADQAAAALAEFGYQAERIRLSELIRLNAGIVGVKVESATKYQEIESLIQAGDELRRLYGADILTKLAIAKISADRQKRFGEFEDAANEAGAQPDRRIRSQRICHVIDSIKNKAELDLLRLIYGDALFAVGVFSPLDVRKKNLEALRHLDEKAIERLIDTDSGEEFAHGQSVRDTFPRCDLFIRVDYPVNGPKEPDAIGQLVTKLRRFLRLVFRTAVVTPTADENAMYAAASAARNSACLSRQVGAAVTTAEGELLSVGWNDVPRSGGGLYGKPPLRALIFGQPPRPPEDERCYAQSGTKCHNDAEKEAIATKIVESLQKQGFVEPAKASDAVQAIVGDTRVKDLIEFSRAVHAEMHAILGAGRAAGSSLLGGRLFVTTYPCHSCARHIVAAGLDEVIYIEPYRKSLATRLHNDSLSEAADEKWKVRVLQFDGVAPRRFIDLFEAGDRKRGGLLTLANQRDALPSTRVSLRAIPRLEEVVVAEIQSKQLRLAPLMEKETANV